MNEMKGWFMFVEIQRYKALGLNKSQCTSKLNINYKTVCKYWDMSPTEYQSLYNTTKTRKKKVDAYKQDVLDGLGNFQIYQQLKFMIGYLKDIYKLSLKNVPYVNMLRNSERYIRFQSDHH